VVNGFLYNSGKVKLCNVKLELEGATGELQAFWPDWAANASYEVDFQPGQLTETGKQKTKIEEKRTTRGRGVVHGQSWLSSMCVLLSRSHTGVTQSVEEVSDNYPTIKLTSFEVCGTNDVMNANTKVEALPLEDVELPGQEKKPACE